MGKQPTLERSYRGKVHGNAVILYKAPHLLSPFSIDRCSLFRKLACNDHASLRSDSSRGYRRLIGHPTMDPLFFQAILPRKIFTNSSLLSLVAHAPPPSFFFRFFSFSFSLPSLPPFFFFFLLSIEATWTNQRAQSETSAKVKLEKHGKVERWSRIWKLVGDQHARCFARPFDLSTFQPS